MVKNIYNVPPPPLEENNDAIDSLKIIFKGMQTQSYKLKELEQPNDLLLVPTKK